MDGTEHKFPDCAAVFGSSGGIGAALVAGLAARGVDKIYAGSRSGTNWSDDNPTIIPFAFDLEDENSIHCAANMMRNNPPQLVIIACGVLNLDGEGGQSSSPERSLKRIDPNVMAKVLALNTIGPAIIAKHMLPLFLREGRSIFAALSARVGSISDNKVGGWHSYRASKSALNMLIKNYAIEQARTHPDSVILGLHPGTVDTALSSPFQKGLPKGQLTTAEQSSGYLLDVIAKATPKQSGGVYDWKGEEVPA